MVIHEKQSDRRIWKTGIIDKNPKGFAFLILDEKESEDLFIPKNLALNLFPGDRVRVALSPNGKSVVSIDLIQRRFDEIFGRYFVQPSKKNGWIQYDRKKISFQVFVPNPPASLQMGDWVKAKIHYQPRGISAEILKVYGKELDPQYDIDRLSCEFKLREQHSLAAVEEARLFSQKFIDQKLLNRTDLRHIPFTTIDGAQARDFDDAVWVEKTDPHKYRLWVAIADVAEYVLADSELDREAFERGTSVYFPERAFHMLPSALSETWCSLKPGEPRLAIVAILDFSKEGTLLKTDLLEAVIQSVRRSTYEEVEEEIKQNKDTPMFQLFSILRESRKERGTLDFDFPEPEIFVHSETGEVKSIEVRKRLASHRLIEEFMIAANEAVTKWAEEKKAQFFYRIHPKPSVMAIQKLRDLLKTMGFDLKLKNPEHSKELSKVVDRLLMHPAAPVLNQLLLRSMKQAVYSPVKEIHYGLASEGYTHFTSPIRRYPDLVVHRILKSLIHQPMHRKPLSFDHLKLVAERCNDRERLAAEAEREAIRVKQARLASSLVGDLFEGTISGVVSGGVFVQILSPYFEGFIPVESLGGSGFEWDPQKMVLKNRQVKLFLGKKMSIQVIRADLDRFQVEFKWMDKPLMSKGSQTGNHKKEKLASVSKTVSRFRRRVR